MSIIAKAVVFILFILSAWSLGVMIDRALMYSAARKQSRVFVQQVAGALREGKLDEAISIAERNKKSHIAKVVATGLSEFQSASSQVSEAEVVEAAKRGLDRSIAIVHADMKRGLSGLATIGSTAPFVGLFGTVVGIINAFKGIEAEKATGLSAVAGGISEALVTTALGLAGGRAGRVGVQLFHEQGRSLRRGDGQLLDGVDQLLHHAAKRKEVSHGSFKPTAAPVMAAPNIIPMADIMLVLLIIFMVVTPMLQKGMTVEMAKVPQSRSTCPMPIATTRSSWAFRASGDIFLGNDKTAARPDRLAGARPHLEPRGQDRVRQERRSRQVRRRGQARG